MTELEQAEWEQECNRWGRVLTGEKKHYCIGGGHMTIEEYDEREDVNALLMACYGLLDVYDAALSRLEGKEEEDERRGEECTGTQGP